MTRVVTSITASDTEEMVSLANRAPTDLVELRLDALERIPDLSGLRARIAKQAIATVRSAGQGGRFQGSAEEHKRLLFEASEARFAFVDIEHDLPALMEVAASAAASGCGAVVSRHDLEGAAPEDEILGFLEEASRIGIAKYAARVAAPPDVLRMVSAALKAREADLRFTVMGIDDVTLRLFGSALGFALVYASHPESPPTAAGQLPGPALQTILAKIPAPLPSGSTHLFAIVGDPVGHSLSPAMQTAAFRTLGVDAAYVPIRVPADALPQAVAALRSLGVLGFNVTTPHKRGVVPLLDGLEGDASFLKAVNTVVVREGKLLGHNTDGRGALAALRDAGVAVKGARALVLGAGATAAAIGLSLRMAGAQLAIANRTPANAEGICKQLGAELYPFSPDALAPALSRAGIVINATPVGRDGKESVLPFASFRRDQVVFDVNYGAPSALLRRAAEAGAKTVSGEELLLQQGGFAFELFTGKRAPLHAMREALFP